VRIARVIGVVTLNRQVKELAPGRYLIVRPCSRENLSGRKAPEEEPIVAYDELSAREGDLTGVVEGREATAPFWPKRVPYDCYNAAILDEVDFRPVL
jgi:microcompartment protein CcmK/EutM